MGARTPSAFKSIDALDLLHGRTLHVDDGRCALSFFGCCGKSYGCCLASRVVVVDELKGIDKVYVDAQGRMIGKKNV
jgi:hypothetical protein